MSDLTEFLLARIAEDEKAAVRSCSQAHPGQDVYCGDVGHPDPKRLAECEAKRRLIESPYNFDSVLEYLALPYVGHPDYRQEWQIGA